MSVQMISYLGNTLANGAAVPQAVSNAFPLPVTISGGLTGLQVSGTTAPGVIYTNNPVVMGGIDGTGAVRDLAVDGSGVLSVNVLSGGGSSVVQQGAGNVANPWTVQGPVAGGVATSGNPVKAGAVFNTTVPTYTNAQTGELQITARGLLLITQASSTGVPVTTAATGGDAVSNNQTAAFSWSFGSVFNGSSWDRAAKPRTAFRLPSSAATNNAANIKTTPGTVYQISANVTLATSTCYLKFFDTTGVPNPAALTPLYMFALNIADGAVSLNLPGNGLYFPTGIGVAIVANPADLDNTAIAAGQVTALNVSFL